MTMGNLNVQSRMVQLGQELDKLKGLIAGTVHGEVSAAVEQIAKKQDKTDQVLAVLMEGQAKIIEMGTKTDEIHRGQTQSRSQEHGEANLEWVCIRDNVANQGPPIFQNWVEFLFMAYFIQRHQHHTRIAFVWIISSHHSILYAMLVNTQQLSATKQVSFPLV